MFQGPHTYWCKNHEFTILYQVRDGPQAISTCSDPVDRDVEFTPTRSPYDPRWMLAGRSHPDDSNIWQSGFFDKGSWMEIMAPWAQSVICGRARWVEFLPLMDMALSHWS